MKKLQLLGWVWILCAPVAFAGGLVTNTNQSAAWARTLTREASTSIDAVYFNPAGLAQLSNGLHISLSNMSIFQTRQITNSYPFLSDAPESSYEADLKAPIFPSAYVAFKLNKLTFSAGFNIIGGGGTANFETGLPSFEIPVSGMVPVIQQNLAPIDEAIAAFGTDPGFRNVTGYNMSAAFNGSSTYMGFQAGATYAFNDMISVAIGARYVSAKNTYEGSLTGITIDAPAAYGGTQTPGDYLRFVASQIATLNPGGAGTLNAIATVVDGQTADKELMATQTGSGITPIVGLNLHLTDMLNIGIKYEHHTKIEMTNETDVDDVGMFPDGAKTRADLPGMFSVGAQIKPIDKISASVGFNYFLDRPAYYGKTNDNMAQINNETTIDQNAYTISGCVEYKLLGILGLSAGFSTGNLGVNDDYQSDLSYALKSKTVAGGVFLNITKMITVNAGVVYVMYDEYEKSYTTPVPYSDTFMKNTTLFAVGLDLDL